MMESLVPVGVVAGILFLPVAALAAYAHMRNWPGFWTLAGVMGGVMVVFAGLLPPWSQINKEGFEGGYAGLAVALFISLGLLFCNLAALVALIILWARRRTRAQARA